MLISKQLMIRKIIIISKSEKASIEVPLSNGLNIILGKNKTGKSSIIKTIFHSFGCEVKFDADWERLNKRSLVIFSILDQNFLLERQDKVYILFKMTNDLKYLAFLGSYSFSEFSSKFLELLDINATWIDKKGNEQPVTPPHLFSFQYIDQDTGWFAIAKSFSRVAYVNNWELQIVKYIVGYQTEEYFRLKKEIEQHKLHIKEIELKIKNVEEFVADLLKREQVNSENKLDNSQFIEDDLAKSKVLIEQLNSLEKERISISSMLSQLQNEGYEKQLLVDALSKYSKDLEDDVEYATTLDDKIKCPFCGEVHNNDITDQSEIIKDIQTATNILSQTRYELSSLANSVRQYDVHYKLINEKYDELKNELIKLEEKTNVINTIKVEGKNDLIRSSYDEIDNIKRSRDKYLGLKEEAQQNLKAIESRKRLNEISKSISEYMNLLLEKLDLTSSTIKLRSFLPVLKHTGSELPRVIYSYYIALYLYNLSKQVTPFKWLVIDTPNQQGQDENNLSNINSALELLLSENGQVIIGSERETGVENKAKNVIRLKEYKKCLTSEKYTQHQDFITRLDHYREKTLLS